ncbi:MAG: SDR family oxidoreductase [Acidobacteriia bacterium]|nr:SDR family oxidoreductase [Terriglobia bacterium]
MAGIIEKCGSSLNCSRNDPTELKPELQKMKDLFQLSGVFLVTGGTRGIGRAMSLRLGRAGATVVANYVRNEKAAIELTSVAESEGLKVEPCRADLTTPEGLRSIESRVQQLGGALCGLIHCAATGTHRSFEESTSRHLDWTFSLNVRAFFELIKMLLPRLVRGSSIIAVSSPGALRAVQRYAVIGASKGALESLARHMAIELAPKEIRVNILAPGAVDTDTWRSIPGGDTVLNEAARRSPIGRLVTAEEVAFAAHFLLSQAASGINGQTLVVDGGTGVAAWC